MYLKRLIFKLGKSYLVFAVLLLTSVLVSKSAAHNNSEPLKKDFSGGDFTLKSAAGPLSLKDLRGSVILIFFGYTGCPTVCPISLATIANVYTKMSRAGIQETRALFISLDPERDNLELLDRYTKYFHPNIIGLTDEISVLKKVAEKYGVKYKKTLVPDSTLGYVISHSSDIIIVDRDGVLRMTVPHDIDADHLLKQLKLLL
jgi:protein SCO1/2